MVVFIEACICFKNSLPNFFSSSGEMIFEDASPRLGSSGFEYVDAETSNKRIVTAKIPSLLTFFKLLENWSSDHDTVMFSRFISFIERLDVSG